MSINHQKLLRASGVAGGIFSLAAVTASYGAGYDLPDQDAYVIGRGMAFVATADNPSAIYYNPAGITQLSGQNLRGGLYGIYLDPTFKAPSGSGIDGTFHNQDKLNGLGQFFYTYTPNDCPVSFGLGGYSPFGLSARWPQTTGFRTVATEGSLKTFALNPVVAFKFSDHFSIGGGIIPTYANADLRQGLVWPAQSFDAFRFRGEGWGVGYNLGVLWQPMEKLSLGVSFRSGNTITLNGHTDTHNNVAVGPVPAFHERISANSDFNLPLKAIFGASYRPNPDWNFEFDADYTDWNQVQTLTIEQAHAGVLTPQDVVMPLEWESSWYYEFGATRFFNNGWHVSAGYIFNENSMPSAHYQPLVSDLDRHFFSVGTGYRGKRFDFDVAYQFGYGPDRKVAGSAPSAAGQTADGTYGFISHAIAVSAGVKF
jgi:long-chain fatty acid transport protein